MARKGVNWYPGRRDYPNLGPGVYHQASDIFNAFQCLAPPLLLSLAVLAALMHSEGAVDNIPRPKAYDRKCWASGHHA